MALIDEQRFRSARGGGGGGGGGLADSIARARFAPPPIPDFGGGAPPQFAAGPTVGGQQLGGFEGLPGLAPTGTPGVQAEAARTEGLDEASKRQANALIFSSIISSLLGGVGGGGGGGIEGGAPGPQASTRAPLATPPQRRIIRPAGFQGQ